MVGQDPAVAVEDHAGPDTGRWDDPEVAGVVGAGDADLHYRRADRRRDGDGRRRLIDEMLGVDLADVEKGLGSTLWWFS